MPMLAEQRTVVPYKMNNVEEYNPLRARASVQKGLVGLMEKRNSLVAERDEEIAKGYADKKQIEKKNEYINKIDAILEKYSDRIR